jgi:2-dehydropantoate 2-reductase
MAEESTKKFSDAWPRVAVVGAGAVGGYFGGLLARAGAPVVMIGRKPFVDAVQQRGLVLDTTKFQATVPITASTEISAIQEAELVLFCVKTTDNAATAQQIAPFLSPGAHVVSLQNGVDNVEQIRGGANIDALPAVVYVAASMPEPGCIKHVGRGDLVLGSSPVTTSALAATFVRAGIPCRLSDNIEGELWTKLIWNCALNAISALGRVHYGRIAENSDARKLVAETVYEVLAVARAGHVVLPGVADAAAAVEGALGIAKQMTEALSSTAQDVNRGKRTEIDSLNGYISRRGAELGVPTPINHALFTLIKLLEDAEF